MQFPFVRHLAATFRVLVTAEMRTLHGLVIAVLTVGTIFYHLVERWGWIDSLYFSVITLTTVGYGDFAPKTTAGKLFTIFYIVVGLGILASYITTLGNRALAAQQARIERRQAERNRAPDEPAQSP
jgi:voltage-gated potassium channel Kch